jgi:3-dehydroquinate dehydratase I
MPARAIQLKGKPLAEGRVPAICAPLVGRTKEELLAEASAVAAKQPDLLEWRVDFYQGIGDSAGVVELARRIKQAAAGIPLLFTRRSSREGGEAIALSEPEVIALYRAVCESGAADLVDYEMGNDPADVRAVRDLSRASGVELVLSFHDFQGTPPLEVLHQRFAQAERLGADVAKVAVMPRAMDDVLTLLAATLQSSRVLRIPVISMSMAGPGSITRLCGWAFGSALTFAVGERASAPGQLPIDDLESALAVLRKAFGPDAT